MTQYLIYNEEHDLMRIVGRQEEARYLVSLRTGWTFKCLRTSKPKLDLSQFEDALI